MKLKEIEVYVASLSDLNYEYNCVSKPLNQFLEDLNKRTKEVKFLTVTDHRFHLSKIDSLEYAEEIELRHEREWFCIIDGACIPKYKTQLDLLRIYQLPKEVDHITFCICDPLSAFPIENEVSIPEDESIALEILEKKILKMTLCYPDEKSLVQALLAHAWKDVDPALFNVLKNMVPVK